MSQREEIFSRLFHAASDRYRKNGRQTTGLVDDEGRAFLAEIGFPEEEFTGFVRDYADISGGAIEWLHESAGNGDPLAQANLGSLYLNGLGVERDVDKAAMWFRLAAEKGIPYAQNGLGFLYANGLGVTQDYTEAERLYRLAAEHGSTDAEVGLGWIYAGGHGVPRNDAEAVIWFRRAAEKGHAYAQSQMGRHLGYGLGVARDEPQAIEWLRRAAAQGEFSAMEELVRVGLPFGSEKKIATTSSPSVPPREPPVFIVGCSHSGTSLLLKIIGAHSRICAIPFESNFALKWPVPCEPSRQFLARCDRLAACMGKMRWVEKTPRHIRKIKELLAYYPDGKILLILRDGRDVACSIHAKGAELETGITRWVEDNRAGQVYREHPNVRVVRYEDLVTDFEKTVRCIFDFIGETYEESAAAFHQTPTYFFAASIEKPPDAFGENLRMLRNWQMNQPLFDGRGKWKQLSVEDKKRIKEKAGAMLIEYGYAQDQAW